ncbi:MAG: hypothetical protein HWE18_10885 [Gammaproteobacteria bacterium]|nr:hypothetical protein [Gammaproteobacteria bacterium]
MNTLLAQDSTGNVIQGSDQTDDLHGTQFVDEIYGGAGDDVIDGGLGADIIYGGLGADRFVIRASELDSIDTIQDFNPDEGDSIELTFRTRTIRNMKIPKELGTESVKIDRDGNVKILMDNHEWFSIMNVKRTDMYIVVENETNFVRFVFKRKF